MSDIANRDDNYVPAIQGTSSVDETSPTDIHVDPTTHRTLVDSTLTTNDANVSVQNPLPTDGDSVYYKDLDIDNCTASGFTFDVGSGTEQEVIKSMVSDVFLGKSNASATNPKTIYLQFKRPIETSSFGINSAPGKYFSNTKIVLGQGEFSWTAYDDSADNTQHNIFIFPIEPVKFSSMTITFHTANEIGVGLIGIFKSTNVTARLQARKPDGTITDIDATTGGNLKVSFEEFDATFQDNPLPVTPPLPTNGQNGSLVLGYTGDDLTTLTKTIDGVDYSKTLVYTSGVLTSISSWSIV